MCTARNRVYKYSERQISVLLIHQHAISKGASGLVTAYNCVMTDELTVLCNNVCLFLLWKLGIEANV